MFLHCVVVTPCKQRDIDRGYFTPNDTDTFYEGESVNIKCEENYGPAGPTFKTCKWNGEWSDSGETECESKSIIQSLSLSVSLSLSLSHSLFLSLSHSLSLSLILSLSLSLYLSLSLSLSL